MAFGFRGTTMENKKTDFVIFKTQDNTCLYHIPSKRRIVFDKELYDRFKECIYDDKEDSVVEGFLNKEFKEYAENDGKIIKRLEIMTCTCCNLDCRYCYAHGGHYNQKEEIMSNEVNKKILNFLSNIPNDIDEVKFFGGEPFLGYKSIIYTCEWFEKHYKKTPDFKVVTNLTYLPNELIDTIIKYKMVLTVSLDGPEEINNQNRYSKKDNINVYQTVVKNIERLKKRRYSIQAIECTYTNEHRKSGYSKEDLEKYFKNTFDVQQVIISDEYQPGDKKTEDINYANLFKNSKINNPIEVELMSRCLDPCHSGGGLCQVGNSGITFMPNGDVYPCHMFVYNSKFKMGNINQENVLEKIGNVRNELDSIRMRAGCIECRARNICSQCFKDYIFNVDDKNIECNKIRKINEYCLLQMNKVNIQAYLSK